MKKVSLYSSDFDDREDWNNVLEELDFSEEEREIIDEVELTVSSSEVSNDTIEDKLY